jgi:hypothetical protein
MPRVAAREERIPRRRAAQLGRPIALAMDFAIRRTDVILGLREIIFPSLETILPL